MDFNKLRQKKKENWTVWVTVNDDNESTEVEYVPIPEGIISVKKREEIVYAYLKAKYGSNGWLACNIEEPCR